MPKAPGEAQRLGSMGAPHQGASLPIPSHREGPLPARSKLDELLGRGTAAKFLTRPGTGERREFKMDKKYQKLEGEAAPPRGDCSLSLSLSLHVSQSLSLAPDPLGFVVVLSYFVLSK